MARYDQIGTGYALVRKTDSRIFDQIEAALGDCETVVNVGAGAGSYESTKRKVVAIEPSKTMIAQRARSAAPAIIGNAEELPMCDQSVDAATALLTVHHWSDPLGGLCEMRRVARKCVVIMTLLPGSVPSESRWFTQRYFPEIATRDDRVYPPLSLYEKVFGRVEAQVLQIAHDCTDMMMEACWRRPELLLDPEVQAGSSGLRMLDSATRERGTLLLREDLASGEWDKRYGALRGKSQHDVGFRLIIARF